jgi:hypothetical protein
LRLKKETEEIVMSIFIWFLKAVSLLGTLCGVFAAIDLTIGTAIVQSIADYLAIGGYTVTVISPQGAPKIFAAPEIDAASASTAIALLTGILLLVGERSRTQSS